jgi:hypothetical protein
MILPMFSMSGVFVLLWNHFAMKLPFPPFKQSFFHPRLMNEKIGKVVSLLAALLTFESLSNVTTLVAFLVAIVIILSSWYAIIVELELSHDFAQHTSLYNPLKRKDEL